MTTRNVRPIEMGTRGFLRESLTITGEEHLLLPDKLLVVVVPTLITLIFSPTSTAVVLGLTLLLGGGCAVCRHQTAASDNQKRNRSCLVETLSHHGFVPTYSWPWSV